MHGIRFILAATDFFTKGKGNMSLRDSAIVAYAETKVMDEERVIEELMRLRSAKLLRGFRGAPPCDIAAISRAASALGALMLAAPYIAEVDVNPIVAHAQGEGATALDALIVTNSSNARRAT